jgi:hypothetical protein
LQLGQNGDETVNLCIVGQSTSLALCMWACVLDNVSHGMWAGVNLALCAVNLGDAAGDMLPKDNLAEIYALAAMTIRLFFPIRCHFLAVS